MFDYRALHVEDKGGRGYRPEGERDVWLPFRKCFPLLTRALVPLPCKRLDLASAQRNSL